MSITQGNAENYRTDEITTGGRTMVIRVRENGLYYIDVEGPGQLPDLCNDNFTTLSEARKALSAYIQNNLGQINKMKRFEENYGPRGIKKKNGESQD